MTASRITEDHRGARIVQPIPASQQKVVDRSKHRAGRQETGIDSSNAPHLVDYSRLAAQPAVNRRVLTPGVVVRMTHLGRVLEAREQARRVCGVGESVTLGRS